MKSNKHFIIFLVIASIAFMMNSCDGLTEQEQEQIGTQIANIATNVAKTTTPDMGNAVSPKMGGYQGIVTVRESGAKVTGVRIIFVSEDGSITKEAMSDSNGGYQVELLEGKYVVTASHENYETYSTSPGFFVVPGPGMQVGNIFLNPKQGTSNGTVECGGVEVGGYCWYLGADSVSCDAVCNSHGGYHEATRSFSGSDGSPSSCRSILDAMGLPIDDFYETKQGGIGCFVIPNTRGNYFGYWDDVPTSSSATYVTPGRRRICACQK
jgi:hypothetical protein